MRNQKKTGQKWFRRLWKHPLNQAFSEDFGRGFVLFRVLADSNNIE